MQPTTTELTAAFASEAAAEMDDAVRKIKHCVGQLSDEQVWWRPAESMNSIANLILHVCGNMRQWITAGVGGAADTRNRPLEFSERGPLSKDELLSRLDTALAEAKTAIAGASPARLRQRQRIQGFEATGLGAILHSAAHLRGHTQEITHMARCQLGEGYEFDFVPSSSAQGA